MKNVLTYPRPARITGIALAPPFVVHEYSPAHLMATVFARLFVFASFTAFALLRLTPTGIIPFGAVDLAGAVWTCVELRRDAGRA